MDQYNIGRDAQDYLGRTVGRKLGAALRERRQKALDSVSQVLVTATADGKTLFEEIFETHPTLAELAGRLGKDAFVVSITRIRRTQRSSLNRPRMIAAE